MRLRSNIQVFIWLDGGEGQWLVSSLSYAIILGMVNDNNDDDDDDDDASTSTILPWDGIVSILGEEVHARGSQCSRSSKSRRDS